MLKKITYENKQNHSQNPEVPKYKKATADDFNELKEVINFNADEIQKEIDKWEAAKNDFVALNDFETFKNATNNSLANKVENSVYQNDKQNLEAAIDKLKNEKVDKTVFETLKNDFDTTKQEYKQAIDKNKTDIQNNLNEINSIKNTSLINLNDEIAKLKLELAKKVLQTEFDTFKNSTNTSIQNFLNNFNQLDTYLTGLATEIQQMQDEIKRQLNWVLEIQQNETYNKNDFGYVGDDWFICLKDGVNGDTSNPDNWKQVNFATGGGGGQLPNLSNYYTKAEIAALLTPKANVDYVDNNFVKNSQLNNYYTKPEIDAKEQTINAEIQKINTEIAKKANQTDLDELNKLVIEIEDVAYDNLNKIKNLNSQVQNNTEAIKKVNEASADIDARFTKNEKAIAENLTKITTIKNDLSDVGDAITDNLNKIRQNTTDITNLKNKDANLETLITANTTSIGQNQQAIQEINNKLTDAVKIKGNYQAGETYNKNDVVYDMQKWYISLENNNNTQPPSSKWALWSANFQPPNLTEYLRIDDFKLAANEIDKKIEANKNNFANYVDITNAQTISGQKEFQNLKATIFKVPEIRDENNSILLNVNTSTFNKKVSYSSQPQNLTDLDIPSYKVVKDEVANVQIPNDIARTSIANTFTETQEFANEVGIKLKPTTNTKSVLEVYNNTNTKIMTLGKVGSNNNIELQSHNGATISIRSNDNTVWFGNSKLKEVANPVDNNDAVNKKYIEDNYARKMVENNFSATQTFANTVNFTKALDTDQFFVNFNLDNVNGNKVVELFKTHRGGKGVALKIWTGDKHSLVLNGNDRLKLEYTPTDNKHAVNKEYVDSKITSPTLPATVVKTDIVNTFSKENIFSGNEARFEFSGNRDNGNYMIRYNFDNVSGTKDIDVFRIHKAGRKHGLKYRTNVADWVEYDGNWQYNNNLKCKGKLEVNGESIFGTSIKFGWGGNPININSDSGTKNLNFKNTLNVNFDNPISIATPTANNHATTKSYVDELFRVEKGNASIASNNFHTLRAPQGYELYSVQVFRKGSANVWYSQDTGTDGTGFALYIADENSSTVSIWNRTTPSGYTNDFAWRVIYKKV